MSSKRLIPALLCMVTALVLLALFRLGGFFSYADTALYDFFLGQKVKHNPSPLTARIVPVDLNDKSEMNLGKRLDDRSAFGDLFSTLVSAQTRVVLDFIYSGEREQDAYMLEGAAGLQGLIVAVIPVPEGRENVSYRQLTQDEKVLLRKNLLRPKEYGTRTVMRAGTFVMPFLELGKQATQLGHISIDPDQDGIFRRTPLFYAWEDGLIPSVSLAAALWELGVDGNDMEVHYGKEIRIPLGPDESISIPIDSSGNVVVPFGGKWEDTTHRYSFDTLANARHNEAMLNEVRNDIMGSLCFVADTTFEKKDLGPIPFEKVYPLSGLHTWVISAILDASIGEDTFFREAPAPYRVVCIVVIAALFIVLGMAKKDWIFNTGSAVLFLAFSALMLYLWFFRRVMPWYAAGALAILFPWFLGFLYRFLTQRQRQSALERYVPRPVAQKLTAGHRLSLDPVYKELTIVFSDIKS
ncbi:MAG: CHASE2 domain-containing protein, partial [Treponema sp.]|nr:CHASE2 domain-containing protein [Treponema sp.]